MKCPVCKGQDHVEIDLHVEGFYEDLYECNVCGSSWAVNHGLTEIVKDAQKESFLEAVSECVEADDTWLAA